MNQSSIHMLGAPICTQTVWGYSCCFIIMASLDKLDMTFASLIVRQAFTSLSVVCIIALACIIAIEVQFILGLIHL